MCKHILVTVLLMAALGSAVAGDDASGPIQYSLDLGKPFTTYQLSDADRAWSASLVRNLHYTGAVVHFVQTSIPLIVDGVEKQGAVYQALERPEFFYAVPSDAMLRLDTSWAFDPGVGGFSMHAPGSRHFISCLNLPPGGVPFLTSTPVKKGPVSWKGHDFTRF